MTKLEQKAKRFKESEKTGRQMAAKRKANRFKASWVAAQIGISGSMLCLLEQGCRTWSEEIKQRYLKAIGEL